MRKVFVLVGLLVWLAISGAADHPAPQVGHFAPDFTLTDVITGKPVTLSALRGRPVLLVFWELDCAVCIKQLPALEDFQRDYQDLVTVLSVSAGPREALRQFLSERFPKLGFADKFGRPLTQLTFAILGDEREEVLRRYRLAALPALFYLDAKGIIRERVVSPWRELVEAEIVETFAARVFGLSFPFLPLSPGLQEKKRVIAEAEKPGALVERAQLLDLDGDGTPEGVKLKVNLPWKGQRLPREIELFLVRGELRGTLPEEIILGGRVLGVVPPPPLEGPQLFVSYPLDVRIATLAELNLNDEDALPELVMADKILVGRADLIRVDLDSDGRIELEHQVPGRGGGFYVPDLEIELSNFFFRRLPDGTPNAPIKLKAGGVYLVRFKNTSTTIHEIHIGLGAFLDIRGGRNQAGPGRVKGVVLRPGTEAWVHLFIPEEAKGETWEMGCFVPGHHEVGMSATLIIE